MPFEALPDWLPLSLFVWALHMIVYHGVALGFEWLDATDRLRRFRVRRPERRGYLALSPRVLFNQCAILLPCMLLLEWAGLAYVGPPHLHVAGFIAALLLMAVGHDVVQHITHRLMHRRALLRISGHGVHHSTGASRAVSACFMSPVDFFLEIVLPYLVPLVLLGGGGADILFHLLTMSLGAVGGLYEHSGYDFAKSLRSVRAKLVVGHIARTAAPLISSHAHSEHHRRSDVSFSDGFGSPGICDTLLGSRWDKAEGAALPPGAERPGAVASRRAG